jgi:hypothetical protein
MIALLLVLVDEQLHNKQEVFWMVRAIVVDEVASEPVIQSIHYCSVSHPSVGYCR